MTDLTDLRTIRDLIRWSVSRFNEAGLYYGHGTENAWDEAVALIFNTLHLTHDLYPVTLEARVTSDEREKIVMLITRRIGERIPVPYLTHEAWFANLSFYVDERVLIPRSPIAELIANQFQPFIDPDSIHSILDLCTGSGCIAIACAKAFPDANIVASDISPDALAVAHINVLRHNVEQNVSLYESDLFNTVPKQKFSIIVSNPPYVDAEDMAALPTEYHHEPRLGLAAGTDGLDLAIRILQNASDYLDPNGILIVEVGNSEIALADKFPEVPFTWLEFQNGGGGVFLLTAEQLSEYKTSFCSPD
ncbi:MAG: 50S ribosomal protein L3 N(5)-glutamine methyltransferase [Gammaproteobacteria bacterium]|nr:50S ribosomal protein L3 N(5)-glutamine methyltransferase [Gammaproteobacteria bacterium]